MNTNNKVKVIAITTASMLICLCGLARADGLSYSFAGVSLISGSTDSGIDSSGMAFTVSAEVGPQAFVYGVLANSETDQSFGGSTIENSGQQFGLGFHAPVTSTTDFFAFFSYVNLEATWKGSNIDGNGNAIGLGLRSMVAPNVELAVQIARADIEGDTETAFSLGAFFYPVSNMAVGVVLSQADDSDSTSLQVRFHF